MDIQLIEVIGAFLVGNAVGGFFGHILGRLSQHKDDLDREISRRGDSA